MENLIKHFNSVETSFRKMKAVTITMGAASVIIAVASVWICTSRLDSSREKIYILDKGSAMMATMSDPESYRDLETEDHVRRFHELLFNVTPNSESI